MIAAVPLLMLSVTLAWQSYRVAREASVLTAVRLRESATARNVAAIAGAQQMLQALAQIAELSDGNAAGCHERLASVLQLQSARYSNLTAHDAVNNMVCSALEKPGLDVLTGAVDGRAGLFGSAAARSGFALWPIRATQTVSSDIIPATYPILHNGEVAGYVYAGLRVDWFRQPAGNSVPELRALWLVDGTGHIAMVSDTDHAGLPAATTLASLKAAPSEAEAKAANGAPYAYASALLTDGYWLIVGSPAAHDRAVAADLLMRRIGQLCLLLLIGLAAVAVGTHVAIIEPLARLSGSVANWREGGRFDATLTADAPDEIRALSASFASAALSVADHADRSRRALEQQDLLMREIHHRVKNNLQIVASLLNLQASRIRLPEARAEFASARDRVRALATLHRHLYMEGEVHTIDMPAFLRELCGQLFQAMGETAGERIQLKIEASPLQMNSDQAVPLSLIVTEAVSNAVKYAFPEGRRGMIRVCLLRQDEYVDLLIEDDGVGIPAGSGQTADGPRDGIGITLIRGFTRQLGAVLTVREDQGTHYSVRVKLDRAGLDPVSAA